MRVLTGGMWERYGRDKNHLSRLASPLYKGVSEDYGRDEASSAISCHYFGIVTAYSVIVGPYFKIVGAYFDRMQEIAYLCTNFRSMEKIEKYELLVKQIESLIEGETDGVAVMANVSAAIHEAMGFFWTGFYRVIKDQLVLGPFQGPVACMHIALGKGVCGAAWKQKETIVVPDVELFPGHIACSSLSRSEIVVPLFSNEGEVVAVLDIDSKELATFDETDRKYLEQICKMITL